MDRGRVLTSARLCLHAAGTLLLAAFTFRALRTLARIADRRDAIAILEHPTGGVGGFVTALGRADALMWLRVVVTVALFVLFWVRVWRRRARGAAIVFVAVAALLVGWQLAADRRHAMRTLCWAASSGVYDRPTREQALARGRALSGTMLGRLVDGGHAQQTCEAAARTLGVPLAQ